jgi:diguanylate cyclase (GGDEF)-like protein
MQYAGLGSVPRRAGRRWNGCAATVARGTSTPGTERTLSITRDALQDFPDTPYRAQLERGFRWLRFAAPLEQEFRASHLADVHSRVLICVALVASMAGVFVASALDPVGALPEGGRLLIAGGATIALLTTLSSRLLFTRYWLWVAPLALLAASILGAGWLAGRVAAGHEQDYSLLVAACLLLFVASGLLFWEALATGVVVVATYALALFAAAPAPSTLRFEISLLALATVLGAVLAYLEDRGARVSFLHTRLLEDATLRDKLTSLANRRAFDRHLELLWRQGQREESAVSVLLVDVDNFKEYNDHFGHQAGDDVLRRLGAALRDLPRRPLDLAARLGGDEFALLLYQATPEHLRQQAANASRAVHELAMPHAPAAAHAHITVSIGAALAVPTAPRSAEGLVQLADEALYDAKAKGRDRIEVRVEEYKQLSTGSFRRTRPG